MFKLCLTCRKLSNTVFCRILLYYIMGTSISKPKDVEPKVVEPKIVQSKFCDSCMKQTHGTDGRAVEAMFHCCSKCDEPELECTIEAAKAAFVVWQKEGGDMPPIDFRTEKPSGNSIQLPNGLYMGPPKDQMQKVMSMWQFGGVARDVTLIRTMLSLCAKAIDACDTDQERVMIQNKIVLGFLPSVVAQCQYDAQNGQ